MLAKEVKVMRLKYANETGVEYFIFVKGKLIWVVLKYNEF